MYGRRSGSEVCRRPEPGRRGIAVWVAGFLAVVAGTVAILLTLVFPGGGARTARAGFAPAGGSPGQDAEQVTAAFLRAWQRGDLGQAARYTSHPVAAQDALIAYRNYLHLRKLTVTALTAPGSNRTRDTVRYAVSATVAASNDPRALSGT